MAGDTFHSRGSGWTEGDGLRGRQKGPGPGTELKDKDRDGKEVNRDSQVPLSCLPQCLVCTLLGPPGGSKSLGCGQGPCCGSCCPSMEFKELLPWEALVSQNSCAQQITSYIIGLICLGLSLSLKPLQRQRREPCGGAVLTKGNQRELRAILSPSSAIGTGKWGNWMFVSQPVLTSAHTVQREALGFLTRNHHDFHNRKGRDPPGWLHFRMLSWLSLILLRIY